jgi:hypothetical protein
VSKGALRLRWPRGGPVRQQDGWRRVPERQQGAARRMPEQQRGAAVRWVAQWVATVVRQPSWAVPVRPARVVG